VVSLQELQSEPRTDEMVRTDEDLKNLPTEERLKILAQQRASKKKELESMLKEKEQEIEKTSQDIEHAMQELAEEDEEQFQERQKKEELEQVVSDQPTYQTIENIPETFQEFTDYNVYNELRAMEDSIENRGYATNLEQERIQELQEQGNGLRQSYDNSHITNLDSMRNNYMSRTENVLERLDARLHDLNAGDKVGSVYK